MAFSYSAKDVTAMLGPLPLLGPADGDFLTISFNTEGASTFVGAQGEGVVVEPVDRSGTITVRIMATGAGRNTCAAIIGNFNAGNPFFTFAAIAKSTGEKTASAGVKLQKIPDITYAANGAPIREFVFVAPEIFMQTTALV